eukprot:scaffold21677_cov33-Prasinocladus_malaysianus.AAC.1
MFCLTTGDGFYGIAHQLHQAEKVVPAEGPEVSPLHAGAEVALQGDVQQHDVPGGALILPIPLKLLADFHDLSRHPPAAPSKPAPKLRSSQNIGAKSRLKHPPRRQMPSHSYEGTMISHRGACEEEFGKALP